MCEEAYFNCTTRSAATWSLLEALGVPGIKGVWGKPVTDAATVMRVQIHKNYRGHAQQVANALWASVIGNYSAKMLIVTDENRDIFDDDAVEWALAYRVNADMGDISFFPGTIGSMLDPSVPLQQRDTAKYGQGKWCRVLIDATVNWELEKQKQYGGARCPALSTILEPEDERRWREYALKAQQQGAEKGSFAAGLACRAPGGDYWISEGRAGLTVRSPLC